MINNAIYDALRRVYGGQVRREPDNYRGYSDHRPDLALLLEGTLKVFDLKVYDPIGSEPGQAGLRGAYVGFGYTAAPPQPTQPTPAHTACSEFKMENPGFDPGTSRMLNGRSTN